LFLTKKNKFFKNTNTTVYLYNHLFCRASFRWMCVLCSHTLFNFCSKLWKATRRFHRKIPWEQWTQPSRFLYWCLRWEPHSLKWYSFFVGSIFSCTFCGFAMLYGFVAVCTLYLFFIFPLSRHHLEFSLPFATTCHHQILTFVYDFLLFWKI